MAKLTRERRCPRCHKAGFRCEIGFTKPRFVCDNGCEIGSWGYDGGEYFQKAYNTKGKTPRDFVEFYWQDEKFVSTGLSPSP